MPYTLKDAKEAAIGAFTAVFFFFLIRGGDPLFIDPLVGLVIGVIWLFLIHNPIKSKGDVFAFNLGITLVITTTLSVFFGVINGIQLRSFDFFGTAAWLAALLAFPVVTLFQRKNLDSPLSRFFFRK